MAGVRWVHQPSLPGSGPRALTAQQATLLSPEPRQQHGQQHGLRRPQLHGPAPCASDPGRYRGGAGGPSAARTTATGSCISGVQTWHPEEVGRARSQPVSPPPPGTSLRGGQPRQLARPHGLLRGWAPDTRPARGQRAGEGRQLPAPLRASLGDPASACSSGPGQTRLASLKSEDEGTVAKNKTAPRLPSSPLLGAGQMHLGEAGAETAWGGQGAAQASGWPGA